MPMTASPDYRHHLIPHRAIGSSRLPRPNLTDIFIFLVQGISQLYFLCSLFLVSIISMSSKNDIIWKDDDVSVASGSTHFESSRDEEEEVRKQSEKETKRVRFWKYLVFLAILATGCSVTATTYSLLVRQEDENFRNVVSAILSEKL